MSTRQNKTTGAARADVPARASVAAWATLLGVTLVGLVIDLWTKAAAFARIAPDPVVVRRSDVLSVPDLAVLIPPHDPVVVMPRVLELTLVLNPGAVFGIGSGKRWVFIVFTLGAMALCVGLFGWMTAARDRWSHVAFGLVLAGGLGNLYDRLVFACVRDFLHPLAGVPLPFGLRWPGGSTDLWPYVSNVADAFLIVGIGILMGVSLFRRPEGAAALTPDGQDPTAAR